MSLNSFGHLFRVTTWGESHGPALGATVDGCPPNVPVDGEMLQLWLDRRKPGQNKYTTQRREADGTHGRLYRRALVLSVRVCAWREAQALRPVDVRAHTAHVRSGVGGHVVGHSPVVHFLCERGTESWHVRRRGGAEARLRWARRVRAPGKVANHLFRPRLA